MIRNLIKMIRKSSRFAIDIGILLWYNVDRSREKRERQGENEMANLATAETIIKQMGGTRILSAMIGARNFAGDETSIQFSFKGSRKVNKCRIILDASDTYTLELWKINKRTFEMTKVYELDGLYHDMLTPVFEQETGLYLSL